MTFAVMCPATKRPKYAEVVQAKPPSCKDSPSEVAEKKCHNFPRQNVHVYYHWFAVILNDRWNDSGAEQLQDCLSPFMCQVKGDQLDFLVESLLVNKSERNAENEYKMSSRLCRALDRFFFDDEQKNIGACLSQYPVKNTRTDFSVLQLKSGQSVRAVLYSDFKPSNIDKATIASQCYFVNANEDGTTYPWCLGLPCTADKMVLQLYMVANRKMLSIDVAEAQVFNDAKFKKFLKILYGAVHWLLKNKNDSNAPLACNPTKQLILRDNFAKHPSDRVFCDVKTVYKIYNTTNRTKLPNLELMKHLGYFANLNLQQIGKNHQLLSYQMLKGNLTPVSIKQIYSAAQIIENIHKFNATVHGDIRIGNILFDLPDKAYVIDFDFAAPRGESYHEQFNESVEGRHLGARTGEPKDYSHDWHSLGWITETSLGSEYCDIYTQLYKALEAESPVKPP